MIVLQDARMEAEVDLQTLMGTFIEVWKLWLGGLGIPEPGAPKQGYARMP